MSEKLRVELRIKNAALFNAIAAVFPATDKRHRGANLTLAAQVLNVGYNHLVGYLNLSVSPRAKGTGRLKRDAKYLCESLEIAPEELFPARLYAGLIPTFATADIEGAQYLSFAEARQQRLLPTAMETDYSMDIADRGKLIEEALRTLTFKEEKVIKERFGLDLDGDEEKTLAEIGEGLACKSERVRQIEARALRKLFRHHSVAPKLRRYIDLDVVDRSQVPPLAPLTVAEQACVENLLAEALRKGKVTFEQLTGNWSEDSAELDGAYRNSDKAERIASRERMEKIWPAFVAKIKAEHRARRKKKREEAKAAEQQIEAGVAKMADAASLKGADESHESSKLSTRTNFDVRQ